MFPKGIDLTENSPYVDIIHKRKPKKNKSPMADTKPNNVQLKFADIKEAIIDLGNPVSFHIINNLHSLFVQKQNCWIAQAQCFVENNW